MIPRSYTAFMKSLKDGDIVSIKYLPFGVVYPRVPLEIASSHIGYHFHLKPGGPMHIIPHLPASRAILVDNGVQFTRANGKPWIEIVKEPS